MQAPPNAVGQHAFGYLVPGRPPQYSDCFQQIEAAKWSIDIENSQQIRDVVVFLSQVTTHAYWGTPHPHLHMHVHAYIPLTHARTLADSLAPLCLSTFYKNVQPLSLPGMGMSCYITGPPFEQWHFIGAITNESPSGVFRVRWPKDEAAPTAARLGISIEPLQQIEAQQV